MGMSSNRPSKQSSPQSEADIFSAAILTGHTEIVTSAIKSGVDVNKPGARGTPPIVVASVQGLEAMVDLLIAAGADVNQPDRAGGITALQGAALGGHLGVVRKLIAAGAILDAPFGQPHTTALSLALRRNHWPVAQILVEAGANPNVHVEGPGAPPDQQGVTPLIYAASVNNVPFVALLVKHQADLERRKSDGLTPLLAAVFNGHLEVVRELIAAGANVNAGLGAPPSMHVSPLDLARARGHTHIAELLAVAGG